MIPEAFTYERAGSIAEALEHMGRGALPLAGGHSLVPALKLRLSEGTVRNYLSEAISKLGAANRVEAARIARSRGWL